MGGFNGTGTWSRDYSWVQDAANGIKILATRQDTEWANVTTGFNLAMTRDGQAVWTGNQNAGGFGITNSASGGSTNTNVATIGDISLNTDQWKQEITTVTFTSTTSFTVVGVDRTTRYTKGRRVRINHNTGATISYATVLTSAFSAGNTLVTVAVDGSVALVSTIIGVYFSILLPDQMALPQVTGFFVTCNSGGASLASNTQYTLGNGSPFASVIVTGDTFSEYTAATGTFTPVSSGWYEIIATIGLIRNSATITTGGSWGVYISGTPIGYTTNPILNSSFQLIDTGTVLAQTQLTAGSAVTIRSVFNSVFTGGPVQGGLCAMSFKRLR